MQIRELGVVARFYPPRRFGFIERLGCPDLFFHASQVAAGDSEEIKPGMRVEFQVAVTRKGEHAVKVVVLSRTNPARGGIGQGAIHAD